jgi:hypothetical protein
MKVLITAVTAALVLASAASSATHFTLRPVSTTGKTVTFSWSRQPGADGYLFLRNGVPVARTLKPSTTTATFWRGTRYAVAVLHVAKGGKLSTGPRAVYVPRQKVGSARLARLVFIPAPSPRFSLHVVDTTRKTITFAWRPQPGADGYQFVRDGAVIARTMNRAKTSATFWKGSRYAVEVLRLSDKAVIPVRRAGAFVAAGATRAKTTRGGIVLVPAPKINFRLRLVRTTKRTVTFAWKRQRGIEGYRFLRNGVVVAQTFVRSTTRVTFWKGSRYEVQALRRVPGKRALPIMSALAYTTASNPSKPANPAPPTPRPSDSATKTESPAAPGAGSNASPSTPAPKPPAKPSAPPPPPAVQPPPPPPPASPPPPQVGPGGTVSLSGSYSPSAFYAAVALAPPGPVTITGSYTVTGNIDVTRAALRIEGATVQGTVQFLSSASGSSIRNSSALGFDILGADNVVVEGNSFDGRGIDNQNVIWDDPAGSTPDGWRIANNSFQNYYIDDGTHSEALFVGYSTNGVIEGNVFTNNGNTGHIFFSYFGGLAQPTVSYPRNICVRENSFNQTHGAYFDVDFRPEIPLSAGIVVQASASLSNEKFTGDC